MYKEEMDGMKKKKEIERKTKKNQNLLLIY